MEEIFTKEEWEFPQKSEFGSLSRKRLAIRKEHFKLIRMVERKHYYCNAYYIDKDGEICDKRTAVRVLRYWRGKRSHQIKKYCHRRFRRNPNLKMLVSNKRSLHRKSTEFWWEYD